jgi:hypothetical protein
MTKNVDKKQTPGLPQGNGLRGNRHARRVSAARAAKASASEASQQLHAAVRKHMLAALAWTQAGRQGEPPVLALKGSAGLGKTVALLQELRRPEWRTLKVLYLVPALDLADELAKKAADIGIQARVIRGRSQPQPGQARDGLKMCAKSEIAEELAALSVDITNTLCRSKAAAPGRPDEECPYAATCPYLAQLRDKRPGLLIAAHQYLPLTVEGLKSENIDLVVIDETFWQSLVRRSHVDLARFTVLRAPGGNGYGPKRGESQQQLATRRAEALNDFEAVLEKVRPVLSASTDRELTLDDFRAAGLTPEDCKFAKGYEYSRLGKAAITAGMPEAAQRDAIKKAKVNEAFGFARVWHVLGEELALSPIPGAIAPRSQLIGLKRDLNWWNPKTQAIQCVLLTFWSPEAKISEVPVVLIDADLDAEIAARFYSRARTVVEIEATWSNVRVRQVMDRAVSRNMLASKSTDAAEKQRNGNRRDDLWYAALDMAERHGHPMRFPADLKADRDARARRPLLVTYKAVEDAWTAESRLEGEETWTAARAAAEAPGGSLQAGNGADAPLRASLPFDVTHLGAIRGKDGWKAATGAIIAGRLEPGVVDIEGMARAVFYADPRPLLFIQPDDQGSFRYQTATRLVPFRDGTEAEVDVSCHPDPRCDAILRQVREAEVLQAIARVRPVHRQPGNPCEIIVATNIPLPGLIVDEAIEWSDLRTDRFRRMQLDGFLPDLAADCAAAYPDLFDSAAAVRQARSRAAKAGNPASSGNGDGCDKAQLVHHWEMSHPSHQYVRVEYARPIKRGSRKGAGFIRVLPGESEAQTKARILSLLPDAERIAIVGPIPDPVAEPEEAARMLAGAVAWLEPWFDTEELGFVRRRLMPEEVAPPDPGRGLAS